MFTIFFLRQQEYFIIYNAQNSKPRLKSQKLNLMKFKNIA